MRVSDREEGPGSGAALPHGRDPWAREGPGSGEDGADGDGDGPGGSDSDDGGFKEVPTDEFESWFRKNRRPPNPMMSAVRRDIQDMLDGDASIAKRRQRPKREDPRATHRLSRPQRRAAADRDAAVYGRKGPVKWVEWKMRELQGAEGGRAGSAPGARPGGGPGAGAPSLPGTRAGSAAGSQAGSRAGTPAALVEWRAQRAREREERERREGEEERRERAARRATARHVDAAAAERLSEYAAQRRRQLEKGRALREQRGGHFNGSIQTAGTGKTGKPGALAGARPRKGRELDLRDLSTALARAEATRYFSDGAPGSKAAMTSLPQL